MAIDRDNRELVAQALTAYMRGEMSINDAKEVLARFSPHFHSSKTSGEQFDEILHHLVGVSYFSLRDPTDQESWDRLRRILAFLKSECEYVENPIPPTPKPPFDNVIAARWSALLLLVAAVGSYFLGWWMFAVALLLTFLVFEYFQDKDEKRKISEVYRAYSENEKARRNCFPFASQEEWRAHQHLLEPYHFSDEVPTTMSSRQHWLIRFIRSGIQIFEAYGAILIAVIAAVVIFPIMYPVWIITVSLRRHKPADFSQSSSPSA